VGGRISESTTTRRAGAPSAAPTGAAAGGASFAIRPASASASPGAGGVGTLATDAAAGCMSAIYGGSSGRALVTEAFTQVSEA
jgi:hypothetical protein